MMKLMRMGFINWGVLGFLVLMISCVPKPSSDQVRFNPQSIGKLIIVESSSLGIMPVGEVQTVRLTLKNEGKLKVFFSPLQLPLKEKLQYVGDSYPGLGGSCGEELEAGETCTLMLQAFSSTIQGFTEPYVIDYLNGIGKTSLSGNFTGYFGTPAHLDLSLEVGGQLVVDFGLVEPGVTKNYIVEIENKGNLPANSFVGFFDSAEPIFHFNGGLYPGINGNCKNKLAAGEKCYLDIAVTPITAGIESKGSLKVNYTNPLASKTFSLNLKVFSAEIKAYLTIHEKFQQLSDALNKGPDEQLPRVTWTVENVGLAAASAITLSPGDVPFTFESSTCPASLEPNEICTLTYKLNPQFNYPLPSGVSFPINYYERGIQFSFLDSKNPLPVLSEEAKFNAKIIDEALLVFNKDGNSSTPFPYVVGDVLSTATWARDEWFAVIGDAVSPKKNLSIVNPGASARTKATNITYELIPNDGDLVLDCLPNCPTTLNPGASINTSINYKPTYRIPYQTQRDYLLRVHYETGRRNKTYELTIQTESKALPLIEVRNNGSTITSGASIVLGNTLPGKSTSTSIQIINKGPFDFTPNVNLTGANPYFSIINNECSSAIIKNGESCTVVFQFVKNEYEVSGNTFTHSFTFDNGLDPSSSDYATFNFSLNSSLLYPGEISVANTLIDLGTLPWSRNDYPAFTRKTDLVEGVVLTKVSNTWEVTQLMVNLVGDDASHFNITPDFQLSYETGGFSAGRIIVGVSAPEGSSPTPRILHAKIQINHYGGWREDFVSFDPATLKEVDIYATVRNSPYIIITDATQDYGPIPEGLEQFGTVKIKNIGQATGNVTVNMPAAGAFKILSLNANATCQQISLDETANSMVLDISPEAECTINVSFSPKTAGNNNASFTLSYRNAGNTLYQESLSITGRGLNLARINISPGNNNGNDLHEYGDFRLGQSLEKTFTFTQVQNDSTPAEIVSISLQTYGTSGCVLPNKIPSRWKDKAVVSGSNIDFTITENTCSTSQILNTGETCSVKVKFQPQSMDKLIGSCLKIVYKPFLSASPSQQLTTIQQVAGMGLAPNAIFNGWGGIYAEGPTDTTHYNVKLQWKPMGVEDNLGTVVGYNVYRRKPSQTNYPSDPINTSIITSMSNGQFEFVDSQIEERGSYPVPLEGDVYFYTVKPLLAIAGVSGQVLTEATEADRFIRVIIPFQNSILLHRTTVNIITCMNMLDKTYSQLDRSKSYSCAYNGLGNVGNIFDAGKDRIIDRYENSLVGGEPSNSAGQTPYLYSSLSLAQESCVVQKGTISDLAIIDKSKRLMNRQDYMIASYNQKRAGCIDNADNLEIAGRGQCFSEFKVEDLIGNAWDFIDAELFTTNKSLLKWKISSSMGVGDGRDWIFDIPIIDFNNINISDPLTFTSIKTYSASDTKCINSIFGIPFPDIAGSCSSGNTAFNDIVNKMDLNADYSYIFTLGNFSTALEEMEGSRYMMVGGSYKSKELFGIDTNRFSIYWTEPTIETIFYSSNPNGQWEGGAARCVLDINY